MNLLDTRLRLAERALRYCTEGISLLPNKPGPLNIPNGWVALADQMLGHLLTLPAEEQPDFSILRRWEGKLDFRWSGGSGAADRILAAARARAAHTCEFCSAAGCPIQTTAGRMTLCSGHARMDLSSGGVVGIEDMLSSSAPLPRSNILLSLRKRPDRDAWILLEGGEEQEFTVDEVSWLLGWLEGTSECADLDTIDQLAAIAALYHLFARTDASCRLTLRDARPRLLRGAAKRNFGSEDVERLRRSCEHWDPEVRLAAYATLAGLFDLGSD